MVKLDWDIESEKGRSQLHKENPKGRRSRSRTVFRLLLVVGVFLAIVGLVAFLIQQRWTQVNDRLEELLVQTVQSEVAALRIGNLENFLEIQRSASDDWYLAQQNTFQQYQQLNATSDVVLTGHVMDTTIDGQRGRVQVEEIIDGVPYVRTWFYWRYDEIVDETTGEILQDGGWHHVPPDYTFWGEPATLETERLTIRYRELDAAVASAMQSQMQRWLDDICSLFNCETLPMLTIDIIPDAQLTVNWATNEQNAWQMVIPSPYAGRARADQPFDQDLKIDVAVLLAQRVVDWRLAERLPQYPSDAFYLRNATATWLAGRFLQIRTDAYLMESLTQNYGETIIPQLLSIMQPADSIAVLSTVTGVFPLSSLNVDWRDFVAWRLATEDELIQARDESNWQAFYDMNDPGLRDIAYGRFNTGLTTNTQEILDVVSTTNESSVAQLQVTVQVLSNGEVQQRVVTFSLLDNAWRRAN